MSRAAATVGVVAAGFPRVSGDEPERTMNTVSYITFSPRERG